MSGYYLLGSVRSYTSDFSSQASIKTTKCQVLLHFLLTFLKLSESR